MGLRTQVLLLLAMCCVAQALYLSDHLKCGAKHGFCTTNTCKPGYTTESGKCPGPGNRRCCVPLRHNAKRALSDYRSCKQTHGFCTFNECKPGYTMESGICPGFYRRRCCVPLRPHAVREILNDDSVEPQ